MKWHSTQTRKTENWSLPNRRGARSAHMRSVCVSIFGVYAHIRGRGTQVWRARGRGGVGGGVSHSRGLGTSARSRCDIDIALLPRCCEKCQRTPNILWLLSSWNQVKKGKLALNFFCRWFSNSTDLLSYKTFMSYLGDTIFFF